MTPKRTPEFKKFTDHFVDLSPGYSQSLEEIARFAVQYLTEDEKAALSVFFGQCLDGMYTEEELRALWKNSRARIGVQPIGPFFRWLRDDLKAGRL